MKIGITTMRRCGGLLLSAPWLMITWGFVCAGGELHPAAANSPVAQGRTLYLMNCAHCHGVDATGDEGPDLHGLDLPDEHVARIINNGKKGEMPKFSAKLDGAQVRQLIAYLHTLK